MRQEWTTGGIVHASLRWGLEDTAIRVKGLEPAGYDPRVLKGMGLAYATSDRGACHLRATFYKPELSGQIAPDTVEGKAKLFIDYEDRLTLFDTFVLCRFYRDFYQWAGAGGDRAPHHGAGTGPGGARRDHPPRLRSGAAFQPARGTPPADDWLPDRFFDEPLPETGAVLHRDELETHAAVVLRTAGLG